MDRWIKLALCTFTVVCLSQTSAKEGETILSTVLTPETKEKTLSRQSRSYYDQRYASVYGGRPYYGAVPLYERLQYAGREYEPPRCGRCYDDRDRYDDDYDRPSRDRYDNDKDRDRYDNDRRVSHRPTFGNRQDKNNYNDDDTRNFNDRKNKNGTDEGDDDKKKPYDDKDRSNGRRDRDRRPDDRDRYRPDYYDRFLRDPYRDRYDRPYEEPYGARRPLYERERYPNQDRYDDGYGGRYDGSSGGRRPAYDDRYDRGNGYDDIYGGYGPGVGRGAHDSFRPWDETYRGQAGWDAGGRGYYFASGRPEVAPAGGWGRDYAARPETSSGWQSVYRDPLEYRGSVGYADSGYRQGFDSGYGQASGWQSVRPYRDQSGVPRDAYNQPSRDRYGQNNRHNNQGYQSNQGSYGQGNQGYSQGNQGYSQSNQGYSQGNQGKYGQQSPGNSNTLSSSTTQQTSYLYQREEDQVTTKPEETTKAPS